MHYQQSYWHKILGPRMGKIDNEHKKHLVFTLLQYLELPTLDFLEFIFERKIEDVNRRAGTFMSYDTRKLDEARRFGPGVIFKMWHDNWPDSRPHLHAMVQKCAQEIALEESDNIIKDKELKIRTSTLTQKSFEDMLTPGKLVKKYQQHAPFLWSILQVVSASPNPYRKRKTREAEKKAAEGHEVDSDPGRSPAEDDIDEEDQDDEEWEAGLMAMGSDGEPAEYSTEDPADFNLQAAFVGGMEKPPGFARNPLFVSTKYGEHRCS